MIEKIKSKIRKLLLMLSGEVNHLKPEVKCKKSWYGNKYGGFFLNPTLLNKSSIVYSFGIGEDISFDMDIINKHGSLVYGFDPTPKSINWVLNQTIPGKFIFSEYGLSRVSGTFEFYLPKNKDHVSGSYMIQNNINTSKKLLVEMKSLMDIADSYGHKLIDVIKMDIEGAEYDVLTSILDSGISVNQILIEFHERLFENGKDKTITAIKLMKSYGYEIFAVSDSFEELSFIKRDIL